MQFASLIKGKRATKRVVLPYGDEEIPVLVRPMNGFEEAEAIAGGRAYAVEKGVTDPKPTDRLFEIGVMAHVLAISCLDPDDPDHKRPFFASAHEVLVNLDTDRIALLHEQQQLFQDECSPRKLSLDVGEQLAKILEIAESTPGVGADPFANMQPVLRWTFMRTLVSLLLSSLVAKYDGTAPIGEALMNELLANNKGDTKT